MLRYKRLLAVVLVCSVTGFAHGAAKNSKTLSAIGLGETLNPDASGMILLNYHGGSNSQTEVQLMAKGLEPGVTYGVQLWPGFTDPIAFTANANGTGHYHGWASFDVLTLAPDWTLRIFVWDGNPYSMGEVSYEELRATGCGSAECEISTCNVDADCDLGFACLRDTCDGGMCFHEERGIDCDDNDICTADRCIGVDGDGNTVCEYTPIWDPDIGCNPF